MSYFGILRGWTGNTFNPFKQDKSTHALNIIDYAHHEIHGGSNYRACMTKDIAISGTMLVCFTTPDTTKWLHWLISLTVTTGARIQIIENITSFTGGTSVTINNSNRNSVKISGVVDMVLDPTPTVGTSTITLCDHYHGLAGTNPQGARQAAAAEEREEWVLKQNTKYYILATNQDSSRTNRVNLVFSWYEHTDKENPF